MRSPLHLAVPHPERLLGVVSIDTLGASPDVFRDQDANLRRGLTAAHGELDPLPARSATETAAHSMTLGTR